MLSLIAVVTHVDDLDRGYPAAGGTLVSSIFCLDVTKGSTRKSDMSNSLVVLDFRDFNSDFNSRISVVNPLKRSATSFIADVKSSFVTNFDLARLGFVPV